MGFFDTPEEKRAKEKVKEMQTAIQREGGLGNYVSPEDYQKVIIEQNQCMINLLTTLCSGQNAISGSGATIFVQMYYDTLSRIKKD